MLKIINASNTTRDAIIAKIRDGEDQYYRVRLNWETGVAGIEFRVWYETRPESVYSPAGNKIWFPTLREAVAAAEAVTPDFVLLGDEWTWPKEYRICDNLGSYTAEDLHHILSRSGRISRLPGAELGQFLMIRDGMVGTMAFEEKGENGIRYRILGGSVMRIHAAWEYLKEHQTNGGKV